MLFRFFWILDSEGKLFINTRQGRLKKRKREEKWGQIVITVRYTRRSNERVELKNSRIRLTRVRLHE